MPPFIFAHLNQKARFWLKIMCSVLLPGKHTLDVIRDRVLLVCRLIKGLQVNGGLIHRHNMMEFWNNMR